MSGSLGLAAHIQDALDICLTDWVQRFGSNFVLGLSGGGDSMALAVGCSRWMRRGAGKVHAVCVDHGLRDGSYEEAQTTIEWARALGLSAQMISLNLPRGQTRQQERARASRHSALTEVAKKQGARVILLAHNRDDQHETLVLRLASKTGLDGLAGMGALSPSPFYNDDWPSLIGRPLLHVGRLGLRQSLLDGGQSWHEDPSNDNIAFGRIRARQRLLALKAGGADVSVLSQIAVQAAFLRAKSEAAARSVLDRAGLVIESGGIRLCVHSLLTTDTCLGARVIGWLAFAVGTVTRPPEAQKTKRLFSAITDPNFRSATLGGAKFQRQRNTLLVTRAPVRTGKNPVILPNCSNIALKLHAVSGNLDQFVTSLG